MKRLEKGVYHDRHSKFDMGGIRTIEAGAGMKLAKERSCKECPFRRDSEPGFLGGYSPEMYVEAVLSPASLACHCSPGFHERVIETQLHCTGLAAFRANIGHICSVPHPELPLLVPTEAHKSTQVVGHDEEQYFATIDEFVEHHRKGQKPPTLEDIARAVGLITD